MSIVTKGASAVGAGSAKPVPWQEALRRAIRDVDTLLTALSLPSSVAGPTYQAARAFPVLVPWEYLRRMRPGDPDDPLLRQVLPVEDETIDLEGYVADPVGDRAAERMPGFIQKYQRRVLLVTTGACPVHCRYCFRRLYPYEEAALVRRRWPEMIAALRADPSIDEVILSGGDPLVLPDAWLAELVELLASIPSIRRLRIHSRMPVMIPQRVTDELLVWLRSSRLATLVVVHVNHPQELDHACTQALAQLVNMGIPVLNQSVLLRGVNDSVDVLEELCRQLVNLKVLPYYLHQLDRVVGAHHFAVPVSDGVRMVDELRRRLPGYAVPRFVVERPGAPAKELLAG